jgi:hypothetical protein
MNTSKQSVPSHLVTLALFFSSYAGLGPCLGLRCIGGLTKNLAAAVLKSEVATKGIMVTD